MVEADRPNRTTDNRTINFFSKCIDNKRLSDKHYSKHTGGYKCHSLDSCKSSWKAGTFCPNLGKNNKGPVDPSHCKGLQDRIPYHALSGLQATPTEVQSEKTTPSRTGSKQTSRQEGSDPNEGVNSGEIHIHPVSGTKEGRSLAGHTLRNRRKGLVTCVSNTCRKGI